MEMARNGKGKGVIMWTLYFGKTKWTLGIQRSGEREIGRRDDQVLSVICGRRIEFGSVESWKQMEMARSGERVMVF
jgi:hypothetical protein